MFVDPFVAGICTTLFVEMAFALCFFIRAVIRAKRSVGYNYKGVRYEKTNTLKPVFRYRWT